MRFGRHIALAISLTGVMGGCASWNVTHAPTTVTTRPAHDYSRWEKEIARFEEKDRANPPPKDAVLFIGSSTIAMWPSIWRDFPGSTIINRGFGGSQFVDGDYFSERVIFPYQPNAIFMRWGGNDIHQGKSPHQVFGEFKALMQKLRRRLPNCQIAIISLFPSESRWSEKVDGELLNQMMKTYAARTPKVDYIETSDIVLGSDGRPRPELFLPDKLHLSADGYKLLAARVRPYLPK